MKVFLKTISLFASAALFTLTSLSAVETVPVGYTTWKIEAGTGTGRTLTPLALPLYVPSTSSNGATTGVISSLSSNTLTVNNADWTAGNLSNETTPYLVRVTSGLASGRNLLISTSPTTPNTTDTLTIDLLYSNIEDLTQLGIIAGADTFEIVECDTLSSLFGTPEDGAIIGGTDYNSADNIWLLDSNGIWKKFYFDLDTTEWVQNVRGLPNKDNEPLMPDYGLLVFRLANQSSELILTGTVPSTPREVTINKGGLTFFGNSFPVDLALKDAGFESIPGWVASTDADLADFVFIRDAGAWKRCFFNGTTWVQNVRGFPSAQDFTIKSGTSVFLQKKASLTADIDFTQSLPYTL